MNCTCQIPMIKELKSYGIKKQKQLYLKYLRQLIDDENSINQFLILDKDKKNRKTKKLNKIVDKLDQLITDRFCLKQAQVFQHNHY